MSIPAINVGCAQGDETAKSDETRYQPHSTWNDPMYRFFGPTAATTQTLPQADAAAELHLIEGRRGRPEQFTCKRGPHGREPRDSMALKAATA